MAGWFPLFVPGVATGWSSAKIGAGGLITGIDAVSDTVVARADVFGAYVYNRSATNPGNAGGTGVWQQLINTTSLSAFSNIFTPAYSADGPHEIRIAPSNANIFYMVWKGRMWRSDNKGVAWTELTNFTPISIGGNEGQQRNCRYKMAIDPINPDVVHFCSPANSLFRTLNGTTTATWSAISGLAANGNYYDGSNKGPCCVAIDPSSSTTSGRKSIVYVSVYRIGLYKSTDGGSTYSLTNTTGMPTDIVDLQVASDGKVYVATRNTSGVEGPVKQYSGTTWTTITPPGRNITFVTTDVDGNPANLLAWPFTESPVKSTDNGANWGAAPSNTVAVSATDLPWLGTLAMTDWNILSPVIDPSDTTKIWASRGQGIFKTDYPLPGSGATATWTSFSVGVEEIVAMNTLVPPGGTLLVTGHDIGLIKQPNVAQYALAQTADRTVFLNRGSSVDYASSDSSFVCAIVNGQNAHEASGYSTNYGLAGTWNVFADTISGDTGVGGSIAASTNQKIIWQKGTSGKVWYTSNRGTSWTELTTITPDSYSPFVSNQRVAADRVTADTFYVQTTTATYVVTNSGGTIVTHSNSVASGVEITVRAVPGNAGHLFLSNGLVGSGGDPASNWPHTSLFYYSHDGGANWADVSGLSSNNFTIREVLSFGFGMTAPGQSYPVVFLHGWIAAGSSPSPSGSQPGYWKSEDNCVTWTQIGTMFPVGWPDLVVSVNGDPNVYNRMYAGSAGSGWIRYQG